MGSQRFIIVLISTISERRDINEIKNHGPRARHRRPENKEMEIMESMGTATAMNSLIIPLAGARNEIKDTNKVKMIEMGIAIMGC